MCGYKGIHSGVYLITANLGLKRMTVINYPFYVKVPPGYIPSSLSQTLSKHYVISVFLKVSHLRKSDGKGSGKVKFWEYQFKQN